MRTGGQRFQLAQVNIYFLVIHSIGIGGYFLPVCGAVLGCQKFLGLCVRWKNTAGRAEFGAHISNCSALRHRKRFHSGAGVLDDFADTAFDRELAQDFQDDVFGRNKIR